MPEPYIVDTVKIEDPPDELLCHRYCRKKLEWSLKSLKTTVPELTGKIDYFQEFISNQTICIHANDDDPAKFLNRLFYASVQLHKCGTGIPRDGLKGRIVMIMVQTVKTPAEEMTLSSKSLRLLEALRQNDDVMAYLQNVIFPVDAHVRHDREMLESRIRDILGVDHSLKVFDIGGDIRYIRDAVHEKFREMIAVRLSLLGTRRSTEDVSMVVEDDDEITRDPNLVRFIEMTSSLRRMLKIPSKPNVVSSGLREFFQRMHEKGYCGHGFVDGRLTIYVTQSAKPADIAKMKEQAQQDFDFVTISVRRQEGVRPFAAIQPNIRVYNSAEKRGTLGLFAKLQPNDKVAALSVAHFSNVGQHVTCEGQTLGKCIWPSRSPNNSNINDVSVIKIKKKHRRQCQYDHENMELQKRPIVIQNQFPSIFSEVFKGCGLTGLMTGTVISTEFELEYRGEFLKVCLVEGDDEVDFALEGDSGAIIKLQKEVEKKLLGVAMVFGGAHRIENVRDGTCMGISIMPSVKRFEQQTQNRLIFDNLS